MVSLPNIRADLHLEDGMRLSRTEFHRRYLERHDIRAELLQGVVVVHSPVNARKHSRPHGVMTAWCVNYSYLHPGIEALADPTIFMDTGSEVQPDVCLVRSEPLPGEAVLTKDGYLEGAPPLAAEISASSAWYDLGRKKAAYERAGVKEYLVWDTERGEFHWFQLQHGGYVPLAPDAAGVIESPSFPGLRLHVAKLLTGDYAGATSDLR